MDLDKFDSDKFDFIVGLFDMDRKHTDMELSGSHRCVLLSRGEEILNKTLSDHHYPTPTTGELLDPITGVREEAKLDRVTDRCGTKTGAESVAEACRSFGVLGYLYYSPFTCFTSTKLQCAQTPHSHVSAHDVVLHTPPPPEGAVCCQAFRPGLTSFTGIVPSISSTPSISHAAFGGGR
jgi:hypothetical protein